MVNAKDISVSKHIINISKKKNPKFKGYIETDYKFFKFAFSCLYYFKLRNISYVSKNHACKQISCSCEYYIYFAGIFGTLRFLTF